MINKCLVIVILFSNLTSNSACCSFLYSEWLLDFLLQCHKILKIIAVQKGLKSSRKIISLVFWLLDFQHFRDLSHKKPKYFGSFAPWNPIGAPRLEPTGGCASRPPNHTTRVGLLTSTKPASHARPKCPHYLPASSIPVITPKWTNIKIVAPERNKSLP